MGFGGPHAGYMSVRKGLERQLPGRLVGVSVDVDGAPGVPAGPADPRAAHPPREGDEQHLHRAGAAGRDRRRCTPSTTARRACARSRGGCTATPPRSRPGSAQTDGVEVVHDAFFDTVLARTPGRAAEVVAAALRPRGQPAPGRRRPRRHHHRRDDDPRAPRGRVGGVRCRRRRRGRRPSSRRTTGCRTSLLRHDDVPHAPGLPRAPVRDRDAALPAPAGRPDLALDRVDDPARLVHDEAQRHHRDGADHLAGVRGAAPVRAGRPGARLPRADQPARALAVPRSPATTRCRCSRTPGRRASSPGCSRSVPTTGPTASRRATVCLIPSSAHGTNAASAVMAGMRVVVVDDATSRATSTWTTCAPRSRSTATTWPRSWSPTRRPTACSSRTSPTSAPWCTRPAVRCTSTARTSTRWSVSPGPGTSAPTSRTSTCTRPSASRTAAAGRASGRSACARTWRRTCPTTRCRPRPDRPPASGRCRPRRGDRPASCRSPGPTSG